MKIEAKRTDYNDNVSVIYIPISKMCNFVLLINKNEPQRHTLSCVEHSASVTIMNAEYYDNEEYITKLYECVKVVTNGFKPKFKESEMRDVCRAIVSKLDLEITYKEMNEILKNV